MKGPNKLTLALLLVLIVGGVVGLYLTEPPSAPPRSGLTSAGSGAAPVGTEEFNQQYLDAAQRLSALAVSPDEQKLAQDAVRIADRELDLEFAAALQASASQPILQTPEVRDAQERIGKLREGIEAKQIAVAQLNEALKKATGNPKDALQEQLDVSQAELNLFKETLEDAKDDLIRAGGDPHSRIQQLVEEHQAASHSADTTRFGPANQSPSLPSSLMEKWAAWISLHQKERLILQAQEDVYSGAAQLALRHDALEKQVGTKQAQKKAEAERLTLPVPGAVPKTQQSNRASQEGAASSGHAATAMVSSLERLSEDRKMMGILDRRVQDLEDLGSTYNKWLLLAKADSRAALHEIITSASWIVLIMLAAFLLNRLIERFFLRLALEQKQRATLRAVLRIGVQVVTVLVILIVIFGKPSQLSTFLGLASVGFTVVLKDFIVSFLGWFVLMGRNGIRLGDWVEINGVRGEVIELGLLRTVLLETGNWTDIGQPTGRQVSFLNQYAIEGYYFNFSTSGQWLWDDLRVLIPVGQNPYPLVEKIRAIVAKETEANTRLAEQEWQHLSRRYKVRSFSAEPSVNVRPIDHGVEVVVRYITRASERSEVRFRLNHSIVKLLHEGEELTPGGEVLADVTTHGQA